MSGRCRPTHKTDQVIDSVRSGNVSAAANADDGRVTGPRRLARAAPGTPPAARRCGCRVRPFARSV